MIEAKDRKGQDRTGQDISGQSKALPAHLLWLSAWSWTCRHWTRPLCSCPAYFAFFLFFFWGQSTTGLGSMEHRARLWATPQRAVHKIHGRKYTCLSIQKKKKGWPTIILSRLLWQVKDMRKSQVLRLH